MLNACDFSCSFVELSHLPEDQDSRWASVDLVSERLRSPCRGAAESPLHILVPTTRLHSKGWGKRFAISTLFFPWAPPRPSSGYDGLSRSRKVESALYCNTVTFLPPRRTATSPLVAVKYSTATSDKPSGKDRALLTDDSVLNVRALEVLPYGKYLPRVLG